jgi:polyisoprenoid-binding protein YceI
MKITWILTAWSVAATVLIAQTPIQSYSLDPEASHLIWRAEKVTGKHHGLVKLKSGVVKFRGDQFLGGTVVVDMRTIENLDLKLPAYKAKLERHLNSTDFFDTKTFPTAELEVTGTRRLKITGPEKALYEVEGLMTIRGQANPIQFNAEIRRQGDGWEAEGEMILDRTRWGLRYRSGSFFDDLGDKMIYDQFSISFLIKTQINSGNVARSPGMVEKLPRSD